MTKKSIEKMYKNCKLKTEKELHDCFAEAKARWEKNKHEVGFEWNDPSEDFNWVVCYRGGDSIFTKELIEEFKDTLKEIQERNFRHRFCISITAADYDWSKKDLIDYNVAMLKKFGLNAIRT